MAAGYVVVSVPVKSPSGPLGPGYYGRYPNGNAPGGSTLAGAATDATSGAAVLTVPNSLTGGGSDVTSAVAAILAEGEFAAAASDATSGGATLTAGASEATQIFSYPSGFSGAESAINAAQGAAYAGSAIALTASTGSPHTAGGAWYTAPVNVSEGFTTDFTFQVVNAPTASVTAGDSVITAPNAFTANQQINFAGTFGAVTGLTPNTDYYVSASGLSASQFQVSATSGGSVITPEGTGTAAPKLMTISGFTFCVQNSNQPAYGSNPIDASADANVCGYGSYDPAVYGSSQQPINNSVAVKFDLNYMGQYAYPGGGFPSTTGLYINGGTFDGLLPANDMRPSGIDLYNGNIKAVKIVYDGSILTMTVSDTVTGAQFRGSWPVDVETCVGASTAYVGFTGGQVTVAGISLLTWDFYTGYSQRGATPTFSVAPGQYTSAQSVSLNATAGASIYYTTNGIEPTSGSSLYSGTAINVSAHTILKAVAIQAGYTDSFVATGDFQIAASGTPLIDFPSGFTGYSGLLNLVGRSALNGSALQLTDGINPPNYGEVGNIWYAAPVAVADFTCDFQFNLTSGNARGIAFVIQNQPLDSSDDDIWLVSGGPWAIGVSAAGMGFSNIPPSDGSTDGVAENQWAGFLNSVAVIFGPINGSGSYTGLYLNGALPTTANAVSMSGSSINLQSGHSMNATLSYNGTTLSLTITDSVTNASFTDSFEVNIPSIVGGTAAIVGFSGADYGGGAQQINNWTYSTP